MIQIRPIKMRINCSLCNEGLERSEIASHMEGNHEEFCKTDPLYFICCGDCECRFPEDDVQSMLEHCFSTGHDSKEIYTEWGRPIGNETKRIQDLVTFGLTLLKTTGNEALGCPQFDSPPERFEEAGESFEKPIHTTDQSEEPMGEDLDSEREAGEADVSQSSELSTPIEEAVESPEENLESREDDVESQPETASSEASFEMNEASSTKTTTETVRNMKQETRDASLPPKPTRGRKKAHPVHSLFEKTDSDAVCHVEKSGGMVCGRVVRSAVLTNMINHIKTNHPDHFAIMETEWESLKRKSVETLERSNKREKPDVSQIVGQSTNSSMKEFENESASDGGTTQRNSLQDSVSEEPIRKRGRPKGVQGKHPIHSFFRKENSNAVCNVAADGTVCGWVVRNGISASMSYHMKSRHPEIHRRVEAEWESLKRKSLEYRRTESGSNGFDGNSSQVDDSLVSQVTPGSQKRRGRPKNGQRHPLHSLYEKRGTEAVCIVEDSGEKCGKSMKISFSNMSYHVKSSHPETFARIQNEWSSTMGGGQEEES